MPWLPHAMLQKTLAASIGGGRQHRRPSRRPISSSAVRLQTCPHQGRQGPFQALQVLVTDSVDDHHSSHPQHQRYLHTAAAISKVARVLLAAWTLPWQGQIGLAVTGLLTVTHRLLYIHNAKCSWTQQYACSAAAPNTVCGQIVHASKSKSCKLQNHHTMRPGDIEGASP